MVNLRYMNLRLIWKTIAIIGFSSCLPGCASIVSVLPGNDLNVSHSGMLYSCNSGDYLPRVYAGTVFDYQHFRAGRPQYLLTFIDLPFSLVMDTVLLPYTITTQMLYGDYCDGLEKSYAIDERIEVTAGYRVHHNEIERWRAGDELVFSVILPADEQWLPGDIYRLNARGSLKVVGEESGQRLNIGWRWIALETELERINQSANPYGVFYLPWYTEATGDIDKRYADFPPRQTVSDPLPPYRNQIVFLQPFKLADRHYCIRTVAYRHESDSAEHSNAESFFYYFIYDICPFRTLDGRDAYLDIQFDFRVSEKELNTDPSYVDNWLDAWDQRFSPAWNSLVVMPQAYQFELPESVFPARILDEGGIRRDSSPRGEPASSTAREVVYPKAY